MKKLVLEELPSFEHCSSKMENIPDEMTVLETFIYNNEPAGKVASQQFRMDIVNLLNQFDITVK